MNWIERTPQAGRPLPATLLAAARSEVIAKAGWTEELHPRGFGGRWIVSGRRARQTKAGVQVTVVSVKGVDIGTIAHTGKPGVLLNGNETDAGGGHIYNKTGHALGIAGTRRDAANALLLDHLKHPEGGNPQARGKP